MNSVGSPLGPTIGRTVGCTQPLSSGINAATNKLGTNRCKLVCGRLRSRCATCFSKSTPVAPPQMQYR